MMPILFVSLVKGKRWRIWKQFIILRGVLVEEITSWISSTVTYLSWNYNPPSNSIHWPWMISSLHHPIAGSSGLDLDGPISIPLSLSTSLVPPSRIYVNHILPSPTKINNQPSIRSPPSFLPYLIGTGCLIGSRSILVDGRHVVAEGDRLNECHFNRVNKMNDQQLWISFHVHHTGVSSPRLRSGVWMRTSDDRVCPRMRI